MPTLGWPTDGCLLASHPTDRTIRMAKATSKTSSGCTSARLSRLSATTCKTNPATFAAMAISYNGCRTRSSRIVGDSARSALTRLVLRWSATDDTQNSSAAATAVATATAFISSTVLTTRALLPAVLAGLARRPGLTW
jgi:hypothetical protein